MRGETLGAAILVLILIGIGLAHRTAIPRADPVIVPARIPGHCLLSLPPVCFDERGRRVN